MKKTIASALVVAAATAGIYFATTGSGPTTWNVTPTSSPSLATVEANAKPGDTVVLAGYWRGTTLLPRTSGTATASITYRSTAGATFDGAGPYGVVDIARRSYLVFDGITFANSNYVAAPVANKGVIVRSSSHITITNCSFTHVQAQLIGASYSTISDNVWRYFVAAYVNGQPQTSGDMLNLVLGSHDNTIVRNDMKYAGHSLIEVGNGSGNGEVNAHNLIDSNTLSNPWYKDVILSDDGGQTTVSNNQILDANSAPALYSTIAGQVGQLQTSSMAVQFSGRNFRLLDNVIANAVCTYGCVSLGSRWYTGAPATSLIESTDDVIDGNTITNCKSASAVSFVEFLSAADIAAGRTQIPALTRDTISNNKLIGNTGTPYSWNGTTTYTSLLYHSATQAPAWVGYNGNLVYGDTFDAPAAASLLDVSLGSKTTHVVQTLAQLEASDPAHVYGNR